MVKYRKFDFYARKNNISAMITELNKRSEEILRYIVDAYMETGAPVGSRTISDKLGMSLSPATIRNVMAELEHAGLLSAPHTSAGRMPTNQGIRFYVDGLMQIGDLSAEERQSIEAQCLANGSSINGVMEQATTMLSGLSSAASLVVAPKTDKPLKQIQFVQLDNKRVLMIMVMSDGLVENRLMEVSSPLPPSSLTAAANYLNDRLAGHTLAEAKKIIAEEIASHKAQISAIEADLVQRGIALGSSKDFDGHIIIRGQSQLLADVKAMEDLEHARQLLASLEEQETVARVLDAANFGEGVQIFIGTENEMFDHSGWSMVLSPYKSKDRQIIGAIGVIGPTRLNYSRVIPILDYTTKVMERFLSS